MNKKELKEIKKRYNELEFIAMSEGLTINSKEYKEYNKLRKMIYETEKEKYLVFEEL